VEGARKKDISKRGRQKGSVGERKGSMREQLYVGKSAEEGKPGKSDQKSIKKWEAAAGKGSLEECGPNERSKETSFQPGKKKKTNSPSINEAELRKETQRKRESLLWRRGMGTGKSDSDETNKSVLVAPENGGNTKNFVRAEGSGKGPYAIEKGKGSLAPEKDGKSNKKTPTAKLGIFLKGRGGEI